MLISCGKRYFKKKDSVKGALYDFSKGGKTQKYLASQLCQTEASEIMNRVKKEIEQSIKETKKAPHMLVDMVYQSPTDMDLAIEGGGELTMFMISTDVEIAGKRSLIRGESSGRFEATTTILNTHKAVASQFNDRLKHFTEGKEKPKIQVYLYDNNVAKGESPTLCAEYNLKDMKMAIHDEGKTLGFFKKTAINGAAKSIEEAYVTQTPNLKGFIDAQKEMGFSR